jgi:hypothetical protein
MRQPQRSQKRTSIPKVTTPSTQKPVVIDPPSSLGSSILQGFGFGIGSSIARNVVDSVMQSDSVIPTTPIQQTQNVKKECQFQNENIMTCMQSSNDDCQFFIEELKNCIKNTKKNF